MANRHIGSVSSKFASGIAICSCAALAAVGMSCEPPNVVHVTTTSDGGAGSLRAAIDSASAARSELRIELDPGTYDLTRCGADDSNANGDLDLSSSVQIDLVGKGAGVVIRQTCAGERVLDSHGSGLLMISSLTITGGSVVGTAGAADASGGGVRAASGVVLDHAIVTGNSVAGAPGTAAAAGGTAVNAGAARGAGLFVAGAFSAVESEISSNVATGGAGAFGAVTGDVPASGGVGEGGGAYVVGAVSLFGGSLQNNQTSNGQNSGAAARGGGLAQALSSSAPVSLSRVTLINNRSVDGGAVACSNLTTDTITATGNTATDGRGGALLATGDAKLVNSTFTHNTATLGGAIAAATLTFEDSTATDNQGFLRGGALSASGAATVTRSSIQRNSSQVGGGIAAAELTISDTAVMGNSAIPSPNRISFGSVVVTRFVDVAGGGIWADTAYERTASRLRVTPSDSASFYRIFPRAGAPVPAPESEAMSSAS